MPQGVEHHREHRSPDDLDGLLRAFFRAEMPDPWPRAPGHAPPRRVPTPGWQRWHRHLALAAAVSFFLLGSFLLTRGFPEGKEKATGGLSNQLPTIGNKPPRPKIHSDKVRDDLPPFKLELNNKIQTLGLEKTQKNGHPIGTHGIVDPKTGTRVLIAK